MFQKPKRQPEMVFVDSKARSWEILLRYNQVKVSQELWFLRRKY